MAYQESPLLLFTRPACRHSLEPPNSLVDWWMRAEQVPQPTSQQRVDDEQMRGGGVGLHGNALDAALEFSERISQTQGVRGNRCPGTIRPVFPPPRNGHLDKQS